MECEIYLLFILFTSTNCNYTVFVDNDSDKYFSVKDGDKVTKLFISRSVGLFSIYEHFMLNMKTNVTLLSFLTSPYNNLMKEFAATRRTNLDFFNTKYLKLMYNAHSEHDVSYHKSFENTISNMIIPSIDHRITIIVYNTCSNPLVESLSQTLAYRKRPDCHSITRDVDHHRSISYAIYHLIKVQLTHIILLLSTIDTNELLTQASQQNVGTTIFITFGIPHFIFQQMQASFSALQLININKISSMKPVKEISLEVVIDKLADHKKADAAVLQARNSVLRQLQEATQANITINSDTMNKFVSRKKQVLKVTSTPYHPFVVVLPDEDPTSLKYCTKGKLCNLPTRSVNGTTWRYACCTGMAIDIFDLLADDLNLDYEINMVEDGVFGGYNNGTWNGMIGEVYSGRADIAVQGLTPTIERQRDVDFTVGFMDTYLAMVRRSTPVELKVINWQFLEPLEMSLIIAIVIATWVSMLCIVLFENTEYILKLRPKFGSREVFTYISGLTFQRDLGGKNPLKWSGRVTALGYAAAMTIVMNAYTAHLTANNIGGNNKDTFKGLLDEKITNPTSDFTFGTMANTSSELFFKQNPLQSYMKIYEFMKRYLVPNDTVGMEKVYDRTLDAYLSDYVYVQALLSEYRYCSKLSIYKETRRTTEVAFALQKGSKIEEKLSQSILKFRKQGFIDVFVQKWIYSPSCKIYQVDENKFPWTYFGGILLILGIALAICSIILMLENLYTYWKTKKVKKREREEEKHECSFDADGGDMFTYSRSLQNSDDDQMKNDNKFYLKKMRFLDVT